MKKIVIYDAKFDSRYSPMYLEIPMVARPRFVRAFTQRDGLPFLRFHLEVETDEKAEGTTHLIAVRDNVEFGEKNVLHWLSVDTSYFGVFHIYEILGD